MVPKSHDHINNLTLGLKLSRCFVCRYVSASNLGLSTEVGAYPGQFRASRWKIVVQERYVDPQRPSGPTPTWAATLRTELRGVLVRVLPSGAVPKVQEAGSWVHSREKVSLVRGMIIFRSKT